MSIACLAEQNPAWRDDRRDVGNIRGKQGSGDHGSEVDFVVTGIDVSIQLRRIPQVRHCVLLGGRQPFHFRNEAVMTARPAATPPSSSALARKNTSPHPLPPSPTRSPP